VSTTANQGSAYVFVRSGTTWTQQQQLTASDGANGDYFGSSVSLSADGSIALVGAEENDVSGNSLQGSAYVFVRSWDTWVEQQQLTASDGAAWDYFGSSVSLSADGSLALIGAYHDDVSGNSDQGSAYLYEGLYALSIDGVQARRWMRVPVPVSLNNAAGLLGAHLKITYDKTRLYPPQSQHIRPTALTDGFQVDADVDGSAGRVAVSLARATPLPAGSSGELVKLGFYVRNVPANSVGSTTPLTLSDVSLVFEQDGGGTRSLIPWAMPGGIEIMPDYRWGDVTLNGALDVEDVVLILRAVAGYDELSALQEGLCDYDHNDTLDVADALGVMDAATVAKLVPVRWPVALAPMGVAVGSVSAAADLSAWVPVTLDRPGGVRGMELTLMYDAARMRLQGVDAGTARGLVVHREPVPGVVRLVGVSREDLTRTDGTLARLRFAVLEDGETPVALQQALLLDGRGQRLPVQLPGDLASATSLPASFMLYAPYPNPFNPSTLIRFALPQGGPVRLTIFNALGQVVETLRQDWREAGMHQVVWQADGYAPGLYLVQVQAGAQRQVRKVLLVK
jgi:hypothetical protein